MKIGIFGSSFNPPHRAHMRIAKEAKTRFGLDLIILLPTGKTYYKNCAAVAPEHRLRMCQICARNHGFEVCDREIALGGFSYTADTLEFLKEKYPSDELFFILGADSLDYIDTWKNPEKIFALSNIVYAPRRGFDTSKAMFLTEKYGARVYPLETGEMNVSSSDIRRRVRCGEDFSDDVESEVLRYIMENNLYKYDFEFLKSEANRLLNPDRYEHSLGVMHLAGQFAKKYGENAELARVAGLLHDIAKNLSRDEMKVYLDRAPDVDETIQNAFGLWHGPASAEYAKEHYEIDDKVYDAIYYHTIGKPGMSSFTKIVFLADALEIGRDAEFDWSARLRELAFEDFDAAMLEVINLTMVSVINRGMILHRNSVDVRNSLLLNK